MKTHLLLSCLGISMAILPSPSMAGPGGIRASSRKLQLGCQFGALLSQDQILYSGETRTTGSRTYFLTLTSTGVLEVYKGKPDDRERLLWRSKPSDETEGRYKAFLQGDSNLIIQTTGGREVWKSDSVFRKSSNGSSYKFGLSCDAKHVVIFENIDFYNNIVVWSEEVIPDPDPEEPAEPIVLLETGQVIDEFAYNQNHVGQCSYIFQGDGVITIRRSYVNSGTDAVWSSSPPARYHLPEYNGFFYRLNREHGSLESVYKDQNGNERVFFTTNNPRSNSGDDTTGKPKTFQLLLTPDCVLQIVQIVQDGDKLVWTSNRDHGISTTDPVLQRGEMFHVDPCKDNMADGSGSGSVTSCPQTLFLQLDCNLLHFEGVDPLDLIYNNHRVLWASGEVEGGVPDNCYLYADPDNLRLYEGMLDRSLPSSSSSPHGDNRVLWEAEKGTFGYTVGLSNVVGEPQAVCGT